MVSQLLLLLVAAEASIRGYSTVQLDRCPYEVLGIERSATLAQVRAAYRSRARDWHPDKHPGNVEGASQHFLEVVSAFELLSDQDERRHYDTTGETTSRQYREQMQRHERQRQRWQQQQQPRRFVLNEDHKRAMARVMAVKSRKHLEDVALGEDGLVDRHLVLALYDPGQCEDFLTFSALFPYPFADKLDEHGIWWEDVLQTAKARMTEEDGKTPSRIAKRFGIDPKSCPTIIFARNGSSLWDDFEVLGLQRPHAPRFESWLWPKLSTKVRFVNDHAHAVRVFWIRGLETFDPFDLQPGQTQTRNAYVSHLFAARDVRAGGPLTPESVLKWAHIDSDENPFIYRIVSKCVDWNGDCGLWADQGECTHNPAFMHKFCSVSCAKSVSRQADERAAQANERAAEAREVARFYAKEADEAIRRARQAEEAALRLESDAVAAEIVADAQARTVNSCSHAYPEKQVRLW